MKKYQPVELIETIEEKSGGKGMRQGIEVHPPQKALKVSFTTWKINTIADEDIQTFLELSGCHA